MGCLVIATPELSDVATLFPSVETVAGPATNLQKMQPTDVWEAGGGAPFLEIDLGFIKDFNLIAPAHTNATGADFWRIRTADTQAGLVSAPDYDSSFINLSYVGAEGSFFQWIPAGLTNRWVRLDFITAASPFYVGRLYISDGLQVTRGRKYGLEDGYLEDVIIDQTDGPARIPNAGTNRAVLQFTLNLGNEGDRHAVREINKTRGASKDVVVITDPLATVNKADVLYNGLLQTRRVAVNTAFNWNEITYQLTANNGAA